MVMKMKKGKTKKQKTVKKPTGRPLAKWKSKANADRIFADMQEGKSLRQICRENGWPHSTVLAWLGKEFSDQYAQAQEQRADYYFDEMIEIADEVPADKNAIAAARLRIDTRKWIMGRMNPKKYSDRVNVDMSGETKVTHDGTVEFTPTDMAISRLDEIVSRAIGERKDTGLEDTGEK